MGPPRGGTGRGSVWPRGISSAGGGAAARTRCTPESFFVTRPHWLVPGCTRVHACSARCGRRRGDERPDRSGRAQLRRAQAPPAPPGARRARAETDGRRGAPARRGGCATSTVSPSCPRIRRGTPDPGSATSGSPCRSDARAGSWLDGVAEPREPAGDRSLSDGDAHGADDLDWVQCSCATLVLDQRARAGTTPSTGGGCLLEQGANGTGRRRGDPAHRRVDARRPSAIVAAIPARKPKSSCPVQHETWSSDHAVENRSDQRESAPQVSNSTGTLVAVRGGLVGVRPSAQVMTVRRRPRGAHALPRA